MFMTGADTIQKADIAQVSLRNGALTIQGIPTSGHLSSAQLRYFSTSPSLPPLHCCTHTQLKVAGILSCCHQDKRSARTGAETGIKATTGSGAGTEARHTAAANRLHPLQRPIPHPPPPLAGGLTTMLALLRSSAMAEFSGQSELAAVLLLCGCCCSLLSLLKPSFCCCVSTEKG